MSNDFLNSVCFCYEASVTAEVQCPIDLNTHRSVAVIHSAVLTFVAPAQMKQTPQKPYLTHGDSIRPRGTPGARSKDLSR